MDRFYVNKKAQSNGDHEVHRVICTYLPQKKNRLFVGEHENCHAAVREAKKTYIRSDGCYYCCPACHKH